MKNKILPPAYFLVFLLLSIGLHFVFPVRKIIPAPYNYLGLILIIFGTILNIWADALFKKSKTTIKPHEIPTSFEMSGPFRISRHPIYLGMAAILLGLSIVLGSLITSVFPVLFVILMEIMFIPIEEMNLERVFGKRYLGYKKKIRRWI